MATHAWTTDDVARSSPGHARSSSPGHELSRALALLQANQNGAISVGELREEGSRRPRRPYTTSSSPATS